MRESVLLRDGDVVLAMVRVAVLVADGSSTRLAVTYNEGEREGKEGDDSPDNDADTVALEACDIDLDDDSWVDWVRVGVTTAGGVGVTEREGIGRDIEMEPPCCCRTFPNLRVDVIEDVLLTVRVAAKVILPLETDDD